MKLHPTLEQYTVLPDHIQEKFRQEFPPQIGDFIKHPDYHQYECISNQDYNDQYVSEAIVLPSIASMLQWLGEKDNLINIMKIPSGWYYASSIEKELADLLFRSIINLLTKQNDN